MPSIAKGSLDEEEYALSGEWLSSCDPIHDIVYGCRITETRPFVYPTGLAIDPVDNVYVADLWSNTIQKFTSDGEFIGKWGSRGSQDGQFLIPTGIAIDSSDNVYVADIALRTIQKFTSDGEFIGKWGSRGSQDGQFNNPLKLAIDSHDNVFVIDQMNRRVQKFSNDGEFITKWGSLGTGDHQFLNPTGIAVDSQDNIFVVDQNNNRIQKFTNDGEFLTKWGRKCSPTNGLEMVRLFPCGDPFDGEFYYPDGGITIDSHDNVFVLDQNNNRIQKFTNGGEFITKWNLPSYRYGNSTASILGHSTMASDSRDRIYTTALNDKVLIYEPICDRLNSRIC